MFCQLSVSGIFKKLLLLTTPAWDVHVKSKYHSTEARSPGTGHKSVNRKIKFNCQKKKWWRRRSGD
jgi:hypothetical protein